MNSKELERLIELKVSECLNRLLITDYIAKVMKESLQEVLSEQVSHLIKEEIAKMPRQENNNYVSQKVSSGNDLLRDLVRNGAMASSKILAAASPTPKKVIEENAKRSAGNIGGVDVFADIGKEDLSEME